MLGYTGFALSSKVLDEVSVPIGTFPFSTRPQQSSMVFDYVHSSLFTRPEHDEPKDLEGNISFTSFNFADDATKAISGGKKRKRAVRAKIDHSSSLNKPRMTKKEKFPPPTIHSSPMKLLDSDIDGVSTLKEMVKLLTSLKEEHVDNGVTLKMKPYDKFRLSPILSHTAPSLAVTPPHETTVIKQSPGASRELCVLHSSEKEQPLESLNAPQIPQLLRIDDENDTADSLKLFHDLLGSNRTTAHNHVLETDEQLQLKTVESLSTTSQDTMPTLPTETSCQLAEPDKMATGHLVHDLLGNSDRIRNERSLYNNKVELHSTKLPVDARNSPVAQSVVNQAGNFFHVLLGNQQPRDDLASQPVQAHKKIGSVAKELPHVQLLPDAGTCGEISTKLAHDLLKNNSQAHGDGAPEIGQQDARAGPASVANTSSTETLFLENNHVLMNLEKPSRMDQHKFSHALFAKQNVQSVSETPNVESSGESYENVVWIPNDPKEIILKNTEVELAWLCEESMYCLNREEISWEFVWEYASPALKVEMRKLQSDRGCDLRYLVRHVDPLVPRRFETKRQEIRRSLRSGFRRPVMSQVVAEMRLRGRQGKLNLVSTRMSSALATSIPAKKKKAEKKLPSSLPPRPIETKVLSALEEEIAWLGEESFLLDPWQEGFDFDYIRQHASPNLLDFLAKTISSDFNRRWLPRVVRLHDPYVRSEFERKREEIRESLRAGFRRQQTRDFLPLNEVPLPIQVRVRQSYLSAFRNQP
jgi:hypothetical protein